MQPLLDDFSTGVVESIGFDLPAQYRLAALMSAARKGRARAKLCRLFKIKRAIDEGRIKDDDHAIERLRRLFDAAMISVGIAQLDIGLKQPKLRCGVAGMSDQEVKHSPPVSDNFRRALASFFAGESIERLSHYPTHRKLKGTALYVGHLAIDLGLEEPASSSS